MSRPPRLADRLIARAVARPVVATTIIGDLHEEHAAVRRRYGALIATLWYWQQAIRLCGAYRRGARERVDGRRASWVADALWDLRHGARAMRRSPAASAVIVATLALAIGANATMFGIIDRLLLSAPPHVADPESVVRLNFEFEGYDGGRFVMQATAYPVYEDLHLAGDASADWAAAASLDVALGRGEDALGVAASAVSGNYFELLGVRPLVGRFLNPNDDRPPSGTPSVVLDHGLWLRRFGADRDVLGREVLINGRPFAVVGVAPAGFSGDALAPIDLWLPLHAAFADQDPSWKHDRRRRMVTVIGRLRDGATHSTALADADRALRSGAGERVPRALLGPLMPGRGPQGASLQAQISLWLGGVTLVVLVIAAANIANLLLLRSEQRRGELGVRQALGMGRGRLLRQMLAETLVLAGAAAVAAVVVAAWTSGVLRSWLLPGMAEPAAAIDGGMIAVAAATAVLAALPAALLPAIRGGAAAMPGRAGGSRPGGARLRGGLLLAQTSLSVVLLTGAGLFVTSLRNVQAQDLGMRLDGVLLAEIVFTGEPPAAQQDSAYHAALERVRMLDGVERAVAVQTVPFGPYMTLPIGFPGKDFRALFGGRQPPYFHAVEASFFELLGIEILEGRPLRASDDAAAPPAVVISASLAHTVWPDESALGKCMRAGAITMPTPEQFLDGAGEDVPCYEVVGVSADVAERSLLPEERLTLQWYTTFEQTPPLPAMMSGGPQVQGLLVKATTESPDIAAAVQRAMQGSSSRIAYVEVRPYRALIDPGARSWRLGAALFSTFGALALVIAAVGIYGVFAFTVAQRRGEMGVRLALGARPVDVGWMVLGASLRTVTLGVLLGGAVSLWAARHIEDLLYGTGGRNPWVLGGVATLITAAALIACLIPIVRAARTDPKVVLGQG